MDLFKKIQKYAFLTFLNSLHLQKLLHMLHHNVHLGGDADVLPTLGDQGAVGCGELCYGLLPTL